jgi:hypothetical protein
MSERALAFVEEWVSDHVRAEDESGDEQARASALADRCLADAGAQGITAKEIGEAIDDLTAFMIAQGARRAGRRRHADTGFGGCGGRGKRRGRCPRRRGKRAALTLHLTRRGARL